jgi:hypothetical protein
MCMMDHEDPKPETRNSYSNSYSTMKLFFSFHKFQTRSYMSEKVMVADMMG